VKYDDKKKKYSFSEAFKGIPSYARHEPKQEEIIEYLKSNIPPEVLLTARKDEHGNILRGFKMKTIRTKLHELYIQESERDPSDKDEKRYHLPSDIRTLPWGHYELSRLRSCPSDCRSACK
jgi:hypothetical protein